MTNHRCLFCDHSSVPDRRLRISSNHLIQPEALRAGQTSVLVGMLRNEIALTPHALVTSGTKSIDFQLMELAKVLAK